MALTEFQKRVCRLLARHRIASGESYVAGGSALNELIAAASISRDEVRFHAGSIRGALPRIGGGGP
jgi:hypothetical protein